MAPEYSERHRKIVLPIQIEQDICMPVIPLLVAETIEGLKSHRITDPVCRLKLWYYNTCAPECYFLVGVLTQTDRDTILRDRGKGALEDIWEGSSTFDFDIGIEERSNSRALLGAFYQLMESDEIAEFEIGHRARRFIVQQVARHLNTVDYSDWCQVTDDFIAYAQNGTDYGVDCYEDLIACVPPSRIALLRHRLLMGPGSYYTARKECYEPDDWAKIVAYGEQGRLTSDS